MNIFGERLAALRTEKKLPRTKLAEILNVSVRLISYWENGQRECDFNTLIKIADYFLRELRFFARQNRLLKSRPNGRDLLFFKGARRTLKPFPPAGRARVKRLQRYLLPCRYTRRGFYGKAPYKALWN